MSASPRFLDRRRSPFPGFSNCCCSAFPQTLPQVSQALSRWAAALHRMIHVRRSPTKSVVARRRPSTAATPSRGTAAVMVPSRHRRRPYHCLLHLHLSVILRISTPIRRVIALGLAIKTPGAAGGERSTAAVGRGTAVGGRGTARHLAAASRLHPRGGNWNLAVSLGMKLRGGGKGNGRVAAVTNTLVLAHRQAATEAARPAIVGPEAVAAVAAVAAGMGGDRVLKLKGEETKAKALENMIPG